MKYIWMTYLGILCEKSYIITNIYRAMDFMIWHVGLYTCKTNQNQQWLKEMVRNSQKQDRYDIKLSGKF